MFLPELMIGHCVLHAGLFSNVALVVVVMRRLAEAFDPSEAKHLNLVEYVDEMENTFPLFSDCDLFPEGFLDKLRKEIPLYQYHANGIEASFYAKRLEDDNWTDLDEYTDKVLRWWRDIGTSALPAWSAAARAVFAMSPSSATPERIFSIVASTLGKGRDTTRFDLIEAGLMLRFNVTQRTKEQAKKQRRRAQHQQPAAGGSGGEGGWVAD